MIVAFLLLLSLFLLPVNVHAAEQNFVTPVFPVRGREYWREGGDIRHFTNLKKIVLESKLPATWVLHYDVLRDKEILGRLKELPANQEIGLFLEVTRQLAEDSFVVFDWENDHWSSAHKLFLSGYSLIDRRKIIDKAFTSFKDTFGYYPSSYGSWYTDVYSLEYIKEKYGANINLGLADQYSTDGYQTWGQYINQPYFVSKKSAIEPAQSATDSTNVLKVLWAPREPTLSYGDSVEFSNFSLQLNDYYRSKKLPHSYFTKLLKDSTINAVGSISQVVIGLEVGEVSSEYLPELKNQLKDLSDLQVEDPRGRSSLKTTTLSEFNKLYRSKFESVSPPVFLSSSNGDKTSYWYMNSNYRLGLFVEDGQVILKDLRFYHQNIWHDNDQSQIDSRHNLSRLVPAAIDQVVFNNQLILGSNTGFGITNSKDQAILTFDTQVLRLKALRPEFTAFPLPIPSPKNTLPSSITRCYEIIGGYQLPNSCLKSFLTRLSSFVPDIRFSSLHGQKYLGLAIGPESLIGIRFPSFKIGIHHFDFPVLENFLSIRKKLTPKFPWFGKQEFEVSEYLDKQIVSKDDRYGQENLLKLSPSSKLFENGYYVVLK